ncbi:MAG TPA: N-acetylmuramoyl-L-alanine amidase [Longimicrobiaceae bacterium]|jgi:N-acetylmuramoyl-L-alanine amidase
MRFLVPLAAALLAAGCLPQPEAVPGRAPRTLPRTAAAPVVAIDPGHPSETSAGTVQNGVAEVRVAWQVAQKLRDSLTASGYRVVLTKAREDERVTNRERARIANEAGAAVLVRLHCDASAGSGFALYHPDRQGTVQGVTGPSAGVIARSREAAEALHAGMAGVLTGRLRDGGIHGDSRTYVGSRQGALTGSIFSRVPVVTVEMAVLTSPPDARFIASAQGQETMARAIAAGIRRLVPLPRTSRWPPPAR